MSGIQTFQAALPQPGRLNFVTSEDVQQQRQRRQQMAQNDEVMAMRRAEMQQQQADRAVQKQQRADAQYMQLLDMYDKNPVAADQIAQRTGLKVPDIVRTNGQFRNGLRRAKEMGYTDPEQVTKFASLAATQGEQAAYQAVGAPPRQGNWKVMETGQGVVAIDQNDPKRIVRTGLPAKPPSSGTLQVKQGGDGAFYTFDPRTGGVSALGGIPAKDPNTARRDAFAAKLAADPMARNPDRQLEAFDRYLETGSFEEPVVEEPQRPSFLSRVFGVGNTQTAAAPPVAVEAPTSLPAQTPTPQTQAEFDALPQGAQYIDPDDGQLYIKN